MLRIGITGQNGFIGKHLFNAIGLYPQDFQRIEFKKEHFGNPDQLDGFVKQCDVIVHLAGMNRHQDPQIIFNTNINLAHSLASALKRTKSDAHILFSSSTQEERDNEYGSSKQRARQILIDQAKENNSLFTGLIIPNVFGPFGKPFYNSVVATFCSQLANKQEPKIDIDGEIKLIYVTELVDFIIKQIKDRVSAEKLYVQHTKEIRVSTLLDLLKKFDKEYINLGVIPAFSDSFELNLFNTFRCYINFEEHFPVMFKKHIDSRGAFVEIVRLNIGGQVSFSTTVPGITRGNHFHTRKIERFAVIKGSALIQLRR
ncbi:MAG: NAD-dependent epimerase/dehydratase family protein, partial [Filimonas sp.]|nr:NAD-dependent epimerase/dehydratase family protein [Filimonas sp.]